MSSRILYVGNDLPLLKFLQNILEGCAVIRCPIGSGARLFITEIHYSLILLDEMLPDAMGVELAHFTRSVKLHKQTPIILLSDNEYDADAIVTEPDDYPKVANTIRVLLES
jgi:DNA-binding response OmpR family regulator